MRRRLRSPPRLHATRDAPRGKICRSVWPFIPNPLLFLPSFHPFPRARHTSLEYSYTFHRFFFFSFFRREIDLFPREISSRRIKQKNEITIRTLIVRGSLYYFGQNFGVITGNLISNFQSLRCILVFSFDGQATTEGYFLGTGTVG